MRAPSGWEEREKAMDEEAVEPSETEKLARQTERLAGLNQRAQLLAQRSLEQQAEEFLGQKFSLVDHQGLAEAFGQFAGKFLSNPTKVAEAQTALWRDSFALWHNFLAGQETGRMEPVVNPKPTDRRFKDKVWHENLAFDWIKQNYLLSANWLTSLVEEVPDLDQATRAKVRFYLRQYVSAMAPTNFPLTNPQVLKRLSDTGGDSLLDGYEKFLDDLERGGGHLKIKMTDESQFEVGRNLATTPGKVTFQNELIQLIQYSPTTDKVKERPLLIVPPWINKFYILDLQPKNSFVSWLVAQGHTVFLISWVNPRKELADKRVEDYMTLGPLAALDAIDEAIGAKEVNLLGFCIGGILSAAMLAWMAARGDKRITSATLLASMIDLSDVGEVSVFVDEDQLEAMKRHIERQGYLEGRYMADMFSMMRENDLIWSFFVNNYLLGREPMAFDLLYWNADSTRLPAAMLLEYLRLFYIDNGLIKPGHIELAGTPIDLKNIKTPIYSVATVDDHIAPWRSCFQVVNHVSGPVTFTLGGSGHIAGIVNPPDKQKYGFRTYGRKQGDPDLWLERAKEHNGSWWPHWVAWLNRHAGGEVPARVPGEGGLKPIEDAPGSYVRDTRSE
ncbi:MAG: PHA/PHB synthase family protein [Geminicoccaceae bacterium]